MSIKEPLFQNIKVSKKTFILLAYTCNIVTLLLSTMHTIIQLYISVAEKRKSVPLGCLQIKMSNIVPIHTSTRAFICRNAIQRNGRVSWWYLFIGDWNTITKMGWKLFRPNLLVSLLILLNVLIVSSYHFVMFLSKYIHNFA